MKKTALILVTILLNLNLSFSKTESRIDSLFKKILERKLNLIPIFVLMTGLLYPNIAKAQPGWQDFTQYYYYTILDEQGNKISFKNNKKYSIIIDSILYSTSNIPNDSLKLVIRNHTWEFENYIRINDLSLRTPLNNRFVKSVEIQIIHKKDTMHLNQTSKRYFESKPIDYSLQFTQGYYYFPNWTDNAFYNLPRLNGNVKFINVNQRNFLISKELYESLPTKYGKDKDDLEKEIEEQIVNNFIKTHLNVAKRIEPTKFDNYFPPFKKPGLRTNMLYSTKDSNVFVGIVSYKLDTLNFRGGKGMFSIFNNKENKIIHWSLTDSTHHSSTVYLYPDIFNGVLYNATIVRESPCPLIRYYNCPYMWKYFRSEDEGKTWTEDVMLKKLFDRYQFRKFEFLDKNHALGFTLRERNKGKRGQYQQGTYYLLKNMRLVDSLRTPDKVHYNSNYSRYNFSKTGDTVSLGHWGLDGRSPYGTSYYTPYLIKTDGKWSFQIKEEFYDTPVPKEQLKDSIREFKNFRLLNKRELVFNNGSGTLSLKSDIIDHPYGNGIYVIEKGNQIYLLCNNRIMLISFDGGTSWFIYPQPLDEHSDYTFLKIDGQNEISFFNKWKMYKMFYTFSRKKLQE